MIHGAAGAPKCGFGTIEQGYDRGSMIEKLQRLLVQCRKYADQALVYERWIASLEQEEPEP